MVCALVHCTLDTSTWAEIAVGNINKKRDQQTRLQKSNPWHCHYLLFQFGSRCALMACHTAFEKRNVHKL